MTKEFKTVQVVASQRDLSKVDSISTEINALILKRIEDDPDITFAAISRLGAVIATGTIMSQVDMDKLAQVPSGSAIYTVPLTLEDGTNITFSLTKS